MIPMRGTEVMRIMIFCRVYPLERPRKGTNGHMYQPHDNQKELWQELRPYKDQLLVPIAYPVAVDILVKFRSLGSSQFIPFPTAPSYGDEDNLRKAVNDGLARVGILENDRWVIGGETWKTWGEEDLAIISISNLTMPPTEESRD